MAKSRGRKWRRNLVAAHGPDCPYCGRNLLANTLTRDHKIPKSRGGVGVPGNIHPVCFKCNMRKGNWTHDEWLVILSGMT